MITLEKIFYFSIAKISLTPVAINLNDVFTFRLGSPQVIKHFSWLRSKQISSLISPSQSHIHSDFWIIASGKNAVHRLKKSKLVLFKLLPSKLFSLHIFFDLLLSVACEPPNHSVVLIPFSVVATVSISFAVIKLVDLWIKF